MGPPLLTITQDLTKELNSRLNDDDIFVPWPCATRRHRWTPCSRRCACRIMTASS